jgi:hypothetical protein
LLAGALTFDFFHETVILVKHSVNHMDDSHQTLRRVGIAGLGLTGAASGLLTVSLLEWLTNTLSRQGFPITLFIPGTVFVVMISAYRLIFMRLRFTPKLLGILAASIAAYVVALYTTMYAIDPNSPLRSIGSRKISFDGALFVGGAVGAFILVGAAMLLFSTQSKWVAALRKALMWSLLGGTLAVVGWELGSSLGKGLWLLLAFASPNSFRCRHSISDHKRDPSIFVRCL